MRRFPFAVVIAVVLVLLVAGSTAGAQLLDDPLVDPDEPLINPDDPLLDLGDSLVDLDDLTLPSPAITAQCIRTGGDKEQYGPTDVNAQSGNQGLSVAFNDRGTVTVFKWPSPSYYDQVKYQTHSRDEPYLGAHENEGTFLGLTVTTPDGTETVWLRDADEVTQHHPEGYTDEVVTTHRFDDLDLSVEVTDVVAHPDDVLHRRAEVSLGPASPVTEAALMAYENMNLVVSKLPALPMQDWCLEALNTDTARYDDAADAIVHTKSGIDVSTLQPSSAAVAIGFAASSDGHQVGGDADEPLALPDAKLPLPTQDAYDDAADGTLRGNDRYVGQTTGALRTPLDLADGTASATVLYAAAPSGAEATALLERARATATDTVAEAKRSWLSALLADFPRPDTSGAGTHDAIQGLVDRALVTLVTDIDRTSKAIVASITTQSPYGADWPRDGAYFDLALDLGGLHDIVVDRQHFYEETQQTIESPDPYLTALAVPPGNWGMNYYADGVVGGPIPWEIDETGYAVWNFWQHHRATGDLESLRAIWPTLKRAADFLVTCADPFNDLQCLAIEDDNVDLRQTLVGASSTWMALDAASEAAAELGESGTAQRYATRADELGAAIDAELFDGTSYGPGARGEIVWPACFKQPDDPRFVSHADDLWTRVSRTFAEPAAGQKSSGLYEAKQLIALAKLWKGQPEKMDMVRDGLDWIVTEHATPDTHVMGEAWQVRDGEVISVQAQPHAWEQVLTYFAALEAYPPPGFGDVEPGCDGVLGALRDARLDAPAPSTLDGPDETGPPAPRVEPTAADTSVHEKAAGATLPATGSDHTPALTALGLAALALALRSIRRVRRPDPGGTR